MGVLLKDGEMTSLLSKFQTIRLCNSENCYMPFENAHHPINILPLIRKSPTSWQPGASITHEQSFTQPNYLTQFNIPVYSLSKP